MIVCFKIWICMNVILKYVILEWKLLFDQEIKVKMMVVSRIFLFCFVLFVIN